MAQAQRPARAVEDGREIHLDSRLLQGPAGRAPGEKRLSFATKGSCGFSGWKGRECRSCAALLVCKDQHPARNTAAVACAHDHSGDTARGRETRDDDECRLLGGRQRWELGRSRRRHERGRRLEERCESHRDLD
jgi:hypothetical protein